MNKFTCLKKMGKWGVCCTVLLGSTQFSGVLAQSDPATRTQKGIVVNDAGDPVIGATITFVGNNTRGGVITQADGAFSIAVKNGDVLEASFLGYENSTVNITAETAEQIVILLKTKVDVLEQVTVVAFATQKKESVIGSITTIDPGELKVPSSDLTTSLAGRLSGIIAFAQSGEPGMDNTQFFIRGVTTFGVGKKDPLILVDNIEMTATDLARLQPDDISSFSIMKDATATALYGARGANGVILIRTKEGREGKAKVSLRIESSMSMPTFELPLADPVTFMRVHNQAVLNSDPLAVTPYSELKILNTEAGTDPIRYPAIRWYDELFKKASFSQRANLSISGGGQVARYYISGAFNHDSGMMRVPKQNNFNNNINLQTFVLRSNININLTKSTEAVVRLHGSFDDYRGPIDGGSVLYSKAMHANPVLFRPYYPPDAANMGTQHILFGNYGTGSYLNPYADMVKGYKDYSRSLMLAQFEINQKLDFITEGLAVRGLVNVDRYAYFDGTRSYKPFFYSLSNDPVYTLNQLNEDGEEHLSYNPGTNTIQSIFYSEVAATYNRTFNEKHGVSALLVMTARQQKDANKTTLIESLPHRNLSLSGRFTYSYNSCYFLELNFGYNGSERFARNERFGFFPSVGLGYVISNEKFWEPLSKVVSMLKLKATYGLVGNDQIGRDEDRFFYMSRVNMSDGNLRYYFGQNMDNTLPGISIEQYENPNVTWERAKKANFGVELSLWEKLDLQVDYFRETRDQILMNRAYIPSTMGLQGSAIQANLGEAKSWGTEISLNYKHIINPDFWVTAMGNFTFARSKYTIYEEIDYTGMGYPWVSMVGSFINQHRGFVAERFFVDEEEILNSPSQAGFGSEIRPGDIKYTDINRDGKIDNLDKVAMGYPTTPEIVYGFGISLGYKSFDFSCFFQGQARSSFMIDAAQIAPFIDVSTPDIFKNVTTNTALLKDIANDHWSPDNRNQYAFWPRITSELSKNNTQPSSWFLRNGAFLRLKSVEVGYTLPKRLSKKIAMEQFRIYVSGTNLLSFSEFDMWDPEMGAKGLNYPLQRVFNVGLNISF